MASTLKSKSFQPLGRFRNRHIFLGPHLIDPGQDCRLHNLYRKPVDPWWRWPVTPECRPGDVFLKPEPAGTDQRVVLVPQRVPRHVARLPAETHFGKVCAAEQFQPHPFTFSTWATASTVAGPAVSIVMCNRTSGSVQL